MAGAKALLSIAACLALIPLAIAETLPKGTAIAIRMDTKITSGAKARDEQYNTFAKRHHLRIFQRPENRTFIHKIDSQIDHEGAKVVFDLMFAGKVGGVVLVERPEVPTAGENATGDKIETACRTGGKSFCGKGLGCVSGVAWVCSAKSVLAGGGGSDWRRAAWRRWSSWRARKKARSVRDS
jgi:hypothetical protein